MWISNLSWWRTMWVSLSPPPKPKGSNVGDWRLSQSTGIFLFLFFFLLRNHSWEFNYIRAGDYWKKLRFHFLGTEPMSSFIFFFLCFIPNSLGMAFQLLSQPTCISEVIVTKMLCPKLTPSNVLTGWSLNYILCIFSFFSSSFVADPATQCVSVKD